MSNFDSNPLTCDPALFTAKNRRSSAKSNRIFPGKGRVESALMLTYLDSPTVEVFPHYKLLFSISAIFRGKRGQSWTKNANLGSVSFP